MKTRFLLPTMLLALLPATAFAQFEDKSFDELMQTGIRLYNEGKTNPITYRHALEAFRQARKLDPDNHIVTFNIARTFHRMGDCEEALNNYLYYQAASITDDDYTDVSAAIGELSKQCGVKGSLTLQCMPENAAISIDGERAVECNGTHQLKEGYHHYVVFADGYDTISGDIEIQMGESTKLDIVLDMSNERINMVSRPELIDRSLLWSGISIASIGLIATIAGGAITILSYEEVGFHDELYWKDFVKNDTLYKAGLGTTLGGTAVTLIGIGMILGDVISTYRQDKKRVQSFDNDYAIRPSVSFTKDGAQAGFKMTF